MLLSNIKWTTNSEIDSRTSRLKSMLKKPYSLNIDLIGNIEIGISVLKIRNPTARLQTILNFTNHCYIIIQSEKFPFLTYSNLSTISFLTSWLIKYNKPCNYFSKRSTAFHKLINIFYLSIQMLFLNNQR